MEKIKTKKTVAPKKAEQEGTVVVEIDCGKTGKQIIRYIPKYVLKVHEIINTIYRDDRDRKGKYLGKTTIIDYLTFQLSIETSEFYNNSNYSSCPINHSLTFDSAELLHSAYDKIKSTLSNVI